MSHFRRGVLAPVPTPFDDRHLVDLARLRGAFPRWLASQLSGVVVLGSTGESALLDEDESDRVVDASRQLVPRDRVFVVGTGRESTAAAVKAARRGAHLGADYVLVRTPGFFRAQMTTDVLVRHYLEVAEASPVPVMLYNFTAVTGVNLLPAAVIRLAEHPNIVGVKESGGDVGQISELVAGTPADFLVFAGSSATFLSALTVGAAGGILALSCLLPEACAQLFELATAGRVVEALALQQRLLPLARLVGSTYGVAGLKAALLLNGCDVGPPRPPLRPVADPAVAELRAALTAFEKVAA